MGAQEKMTSIGQPVPELPVADVERAQQRGRDSASALKTQLGHHAASGNLDSFRISAMLKV